MVQYCFIYVQCKSTFLCNSCSDAAELKAGNESRMLPGSFKVRLFTFVTQSLAQESEWFGL